MSAVRLFNEYLVAILVSLIHREPGEMFFEQTNLLRLHVYKP